MTNISANANLNGVRISPRKVSIVASVVRRMSVSEALVQLEFSKKRAAYILRKVIASAIANAENNHNINSDNLIVKTIDIGSGSTLKRFKPRARGRASSIKHRFSNIRVVLSIS